MRGYIKRTTMFLMVCFIICGLIAPLGYSKEVKIGYVDLRRAFYEYNKTQELETELNVATEESQGKRTKKIEQITKLRGEVELLNGDAKANKQKDIEAKLADLQEFDRTTRQELLNQKNEMFRQIVEDIQGIVETIGKKDAYDYVLDSRNIMYSNESFDLTDMVIKELNK